MDALAPLWSVAKLVVLLAGLLVPGAALMRALRVPLTIATAFAGSALSIYASVLAAQLCGWRISLGTMAGGLVAIVLAACLVRGGSGDGSRADSSLHSRAGLQEKPRLSGIFVFVYALFAVAALWRAWHEPLAGPDIEFRWSFLAEQMLRVGSLDFYPPRTSEHFAEYFWAESIPPGASALHAWAYACAGRMQPEWTVPAVGLQLWSIHELSWRTAERRGGRGAGLLTLLAAAACPLLTWSVVLGQETGLTSLAVVGIAFATVLWRDSRAVGGAALVGMFAALGATAREYGLVFPVVGAAALLVSHPDRRAWVAFGAGILVAAVWPVRSWILTGNPFYSLDLASVFPTNPRFLAWIEHDAAAFGAPLHSVAGWRDIARYFVLFAPLALVGWWVLAVGATRRSRESIWAGGTVLVLLALWAASVRYTNGGLFYSLRVVSPALALGAIAAGIGLARGQQAQARPVPLFAVLTTLVVVATLPATLALPQNPWRTPPRAWPAFARPASSTGAPDPTLEVLLRHAGETQNTSGAPALGPVLADAPGFQRRFLPAGVRVIPLWSPRGDWLFDRSLSAADAARGWRESGVRHLIVTKWQSNIDFFNTHSRWAEPPFQVQLIGETASTAVFSIRAVD